MIQSGIITPIDHHSIQTPNPHQQNKNKANRTGTQTFIGPEN